MSIKITSGILIIAIAISTSATNLWKNKLDDYEIDGDCENLNRDKCLEMKQSYEKKSHNYAITEVMEKFPNYHSHLHSIPSFRCACDVEYQPLYLGDSYYPSYLRNGTCKSEKCGVNHRCVEKQYRIAVLKKIGGNDMDYQNSIGIGFPENLKGVWQPEIKVVTVACECSQ